MIAVVIPCYQVEKQILGVLSAIGPECQAIYVVDDHCPEGTGDRVEADCRDPRVRVVRNERNLGVGGATLAKLISQMRCGGAIAACGLAGGTDLNSSVFPFILRGVSLLGINSVYIPPNLRLRAWQRVAQDLPRERLEEMIRVEPLAKVTRLAEEVLAGKVRGRVVVELT